MRYRLRTLLILLAVLPPTAAGVWFGVPLALNWLIYLTCCSSG